MSDSRICGGWASLPPMNTPRGAWLDDLSWPEASARFKDDAVALVPVVAVVPRSPHLPRKADAVIARALCQKLIERLPVVVAPVETSARAVRESVADLRAQGARRVALLDGGGDAASLPDLPALRLHADGIDADDHFTSCLLALEPRSVRAQLLSPAHDSSAFKGERAMAAQIDRIVDALVARWPDLA